MRTYIVKVVVIVIVVFIDVLEIIVLVKALVLERLASEVIDSAGNDL